VSKDPSLFRGGINLYTYSYNDPVNYVDANGRNPIAVAVIVGAAIVAGVDALLNWQHDVRDDAHDRYPMRPELPPLPGQADAFQHCVASCKIAQSFGSGTAAFLGWANEANATLGGTQTPEDKMMDDFNNACGRSYASDDADCGLACASALGNGILERRDAPNYP